MPPDSHLSRTIINRPKRDTGKRALTSDNVHHPGKVRFTGPFFGIVLPLRQLRALKSIATHKWNLRKKAHAEAQSELHILTSKMLIINRLHVSTVGSIALLGRRQPRTAREMHEIPQQASPHALGDGCSRSRRFQTLHNNSHCSKQFHFSALSLSLQVFHMITHSTSKLSFLFTFKAWTQEK